MDSEGAVVDVTVEVPVSPPAPARVPHELPRTGTDAISFAAIGLTLVLLGALALVAAHTSEKAMKIRRRFSLATLVLAAMAMAALSVPAGAQTTVDVTLSEAAASRVLYVENMTGAALTSLDFGAARSLPFRVRVVDDSFGRQPFTVNATMTNLYLDTGTINYSTKIASSQLTMGSQTNPLSVLNVTATVQPLVDTVTSVTDGAICTVLGLAGSTCELTTSGLTGNIQEITVPVDLSDLTNLPLLPQANETGSFTGAEYATGTVGAGDPAASGTPTSRRLVAGSPVSTATVLGPLQAALATTPLSTLVPTDEVVESLAAQYPAVWGLLSTAQINSILASTVGTVQALTGARVLAQTGTYMSLPTLNVTVPAGATAGDYRGTLVVTALQ